MAFDLLLAGGTVVDPVSPRRPRLDVGVSGDRIAAIEPELPRESAKRVIDARGCHVTPGLIDFHIHSYWGVNPYGFDADPVCLRSGVTTAIDAGSAGPVNFLGFKHLVAARSRTRMLGFICIAQHGVLHTPGELEDLRFADPKGAAGIVKAHPDIAVGIKVRLHRRAAADHPREALRLALEAGEASGSPVMVHIGDTAMPIEDIVEMLRPRDIVTHCFTPQKPAIVDEDGSVRGAVLRARERGVLFDVGHAMGHFDFNLVRKALAGGLAPDIISTDLHGLMPPSNPVVDLPTTMTKFLTLGMSLGEVVAACTVNPARAIGCQNRLGALAPGREADLAVLALLDEPATLRDSAGGKLTANRRIAARWTIRRGEVYQGIR